MYQLHSQQLLNPNQLGFTPQRGIVDALMMMMMKYVEQSFSEGQYMILVSLNVQSAFDAAWCPNILNTPKEFQCLRNLYNLAKSYFSARRAAMTTNIRVEKLVTKGCPQGSCCGPGFWNIQYNSLLNL
jgi:Reverse transcriptase (RNA-dependent DNA polymerase).